MKLSDLHGDDEAVLYVEVEGRLLAVSRAYRKIEGDKERVVLVPAKPRVRASRAKGQAPAIDRWVEGVDLPQGGEDESAD